MNEKGKAKAWHKTKPEVLEGVTELSRDTYGFTIRPQHADRYKKFSEIYKKEEGERSDRWESFLADCGPPPHTPLEGDDISKDVSSPGDSLVWARLRPTLWPVEKALEGRVPAVTSQAEWRSIVNSREVKEQHQKESTSVSRKVEPAGSLVQSHDGVTAGSHVTRIFQFEEGKGPAASDDVTNISGGEGVPEESPLPKAKDGSESRSSIDAAGQQLVTSVTAEVDVEEDSFQQVEAGATGEDKTIADTPVVLPEVAAGTPLELLGSSNPELAAPGKDEEELQGKNAATPLDAQGTDLIKTSQEATKATKKLAEEPPSLPLPDVVEKAAKVVSDKELHSLVIGGVPMAYRGELWQIFAGTKHRRVPGYYASLVNRNDTVGPKESAKLTLAEIYNKIREKDASEVWSIQIEKDLQRTFPGHPALDSSGRDALRRLLTAYARHNPAVGYCQGMNFLAGLLLLLMPEENAFWTLLGLLDQYLEGYYTEQMLEAQVDQLAFDALVRLKFPRLAGHLDSLGVQVTWVSGPWFLSVFVNVLPWESVLRVWDVMLFEGNRSMLFRVALAILEMHAKALSETDDPGDAMSLLQQIAGTTFDSSQLVLCASMEYDDVDDAFLQALRNMHRPTVQKSLQDRELSLARYQSLRNNRLRAEAQAALEESMALMAPGLPLAAPVRISSSSVTASGIPLPALPAGRGELAAQPPRQLSLARYNAVRAARLANEAATALETPPPGKVTPAILDERVLDGNRRWQQALAQHEDKVKRHLSTKLMRLASEGANDLPGGSSSKVQELSDRLLGMHSSEPMPTIESGVTSSEANAAQSHESPIMKYKDQQSSEAPSVHPYATPQKTKALLGEQQRAVKVDAEEDTGEEAAEEDTGKAAAEEDIGEEAAGEQSEALPEEEEVEAQGGVDGDQQADQTAAAAVISSENLSEEAKEIEYLQLQVAWLKEKLVGAVESQDAATVRADELQVALVELANGDNRRQLCTQVETLQSKVAALEAERVAKEYAILSLGAAQDEAQVEAERAKTELRKLKAEMKEEVEKLQKEVSELHQSMAVKYQQAESIMIERNRLAKEVESLEGQLAKQHGTVRGELVSMLTSMAEKEATLTKMLEEKDAALVKKEAEYSNMVEVVTQLQEEQSSTESRRNAAELQVHSQRKVVDLLIEKNRELEERQVVLEKRVLMAESMLQAFMEADGATTYSTFNRKDAGQETSGPVPTKPFLAKSASARYVEEEADLRIATRAQTMPGSSEAKSLLKPLFSLQPKRVPTGGSNFHNSPLGSPSSPNVTLAHGKVSKPVGQPPKSPKSMVETATTGMENISAFFAGKVIPSIPVLSNVQNPSHS